MRLTNLLESPQFTLYKPKLDDPKENAKLAEQWGGWIDGETPIRVFGKAEVFHFGSKMFSIIDKRVFYFAELAQVNTPLGRAVYQEEVWIDATKNIGALGLPSFMMMDYLLPKYQVLCCDRSQSTDGQRLWLRVIGRAWEAKKDVMAWDQLTGELKPLLSGDDIPKEWIWGDDPLYKNRRVLIRN